MCEAISTQQLFVALSVGQPLHADFLLRDWENQAQKLGKELWLLAANACNACGNTSRQLSEHHVNMPIPKLPVVLYHLHLEQIVGAG